MDVFEAIYTLRAMRRLKPDPVPEELIWRVLEAATRAPSGGNRQPWVFIVVTDAEKKQRIGEWYLDGWNRVYGGKRREEMLSNPDSARTFRSADELAHNIARVPVLIFAAVRIEPNSASGPGPNIYPAIQNLMLAARALELGSTLTTLHKTHDQEANELLGLPDDVKTMAMIPLGWPRGRFGPGPRKPVEEVVHWEAFGERGTRKQT